MQSTTIPSQSHLLPSPAETAMFMIGSAVELTILRRYAPPAKRMPLSTSRSCHTATLKPDAHRHNNFSSSLLKLSKVRLHQVSLSTCTTCMSTLGSTVCAHACRDACDRRCGCLKKNINRPETPAQAHLACLYPRPRFLSLLTTHIENRKSCHVHLFLALTQPWT